MSWIGPISPHHLTERTKLPRLDGHPALVIWPRKGVSCVGRSSKYSKEFRDDAVALVLSTGVGLVQAGRDLGVNPETGITALRLGTAVPPVGGWRFTTLPPPVISTADVQLLLDSCDYSSVIGVRDFAMMTLVARLGLRSIEVARLELRDVDWRTTATIKTALGGGYCLRAPVQGSCPFANTCEHCPASTPPTATSPS
jgi:hypothetical protein